MLCGDRFGLRCRQRNDVCTRQSQHLGCLQGGDAGGVQSRKVCRLHAHQLRCGQGIGLVTGQGLCLRGAQGHYLAGQQGGNAVGRQGYRVLRGLQGSDLRCS